MTHHHRKAPMFQIQTSTEVKLASFNVRTEKHGDDDGAVAAVRPA